LSRHSQCMCSPPSTFFGDWLACRMCLYQHGGLSEQEFNRASAVLVAASAMLCKATPTAAFPVIFQSAVAAAANDVSGATTYLDKYPGNGAVSLYYTATGSQGPGLAGRLSHGSDRRLTRFCSCNWCRQAKQRDNAGLDQSDAVPDRVAECANAEGWADHDIEGRSRANGGLSPGRLCSGCRRHSRSWAVIWIGVVCGGIHVAS
jgi:hypothetical protein